MKNHKHNYKRIGAFSERCEKCGANRRLRKKDYEVLFKYLIRKIQTNLT